LSSANLFSWQIRQVHNAGLPPKHMSGIRRMFRGKRLNCHRQQTFTNHTRKGINRIQIRIVILISVGYRLGYGNVVPFASTPRAMRRHRVGSQLHSATATSRSKYNGHHVVRNLSDGGACLKVASPIEIPDTFDLVLDADSVRHCRVAWRKAMQNRSYVRLIGLDRAPRRGHRDKGQLKPFGFGATLRAACKLASPRRNFYEHLLIVRPSAGHSAAKDFVHIGHGGG